MEIYMAKGGVEYVRQRANQFIRSREKLREELISDLVFDACVGGCDDIHVRKIGEWNIVASSADWLEGNIREVKPIELFGLLTALPQAGANFHRHEVLVGAFSKSVSIYLNGVREASIGEENFLEIDELVASVFPSHRVIAFVAAEVGENFFSHEL